MVKMNFQNSTLEKIVRRFKWTRENTVLIFEEAEKYKILDKNPFSLLQNKFTFQPVLYQFQCILTTTDTYYRKLIHAENQNYAILVTEKEVIAKKDISPEIIKGTLRIQSFQLEELLKRYNEKQMNEFIKQILTISDHEYLHQGQLILMLRALGVDLPSRYKKAWVL